MWDASNDRTEVATTARPAEASAGLSAGSDALRDAYPRGASQVPEELGRVLFDTPRSRDGTGHGKVTADNGEVLVFAFDNFHDGDLARLPAEQRNVLARVFRRAHGIESAEDYRQRVRAVASVELP